MTDQPNPSIAGLLVRPLAIALLLGVFAPVANAQSSTPLRASAILEEDDAPAPPRTPQNAAWAYYKAWDTITTVEDRQKFGELTTGRPDPGKPLTKAQRQILEKHRVYLDGVIAATSMDTCDWGSRTDVGLGALIPHLGYMRQSARALALDARRFAEDGNSVAAAERVVALLRLSSHAATDHYLISTLVAAAIGHLAMSLTDELLKADQLTAPAARMIVSAIRQVDTPDLYNTAAAIDLERRVTLDWFRKECSGDNANIKFVRALSTSSSMRGESSRTRTPIALYLLTFSEQRIQAEIDRADRYFDAVAAAWRKPHAAVALDELETQVQEYQWGFVTQATMASFSTVRRSTDRTRETYQKSSAKLRAILEAQEAHGGAPK